MPLPAAIADIVHDAPMPSLLSLSSSVLSAGGINSSRSIRSMVLDSIWETENFGKGWLGYNIMPRAPTAVFVELLVSASLVLALVMTPLTKKLSQQRQLTCHVPILVGESPHHQNPASTHPDNCPFAGPLQQGHYC